MMPLTSHPRAGDIDVRTKRSIVFVVAAVGVALFATAAAADVKKITLTVDTTWSGQMAIDGRLTVAEGTTLTIKPGTVVKISGDWGAKLVVKGRLHAVGTKDKPIRFKVGTKNSYWSGITFYDRKATGAVEWCRFRNGRHVTISCYAASPTIRHNAFVFSRYGGRAILCQDGSRARIENNRMTTDGRGSGVLVVNASPTISGNIFKGFRVGVQVSARTRKIVWDDEDEMKKAMSIAVPPHVKPACKANVCSGGLALFDERAADSGAWRRSFASSVVSMRQLRRFEVERTKDGDLVRLMTAEGSTGEMDRHELRLATGKYVLKAEVVKMDVTAATWRKKWPWSGDVSITIAGRSCRLVRIQTALGQLGMEGCADTMSAHLLLIRPPVKADKTGIPEVLWASPKIDRGNLLCAVADMNGDGKPEILVATKKWCEGKGQILVFERSSSRLPDKGKATTRPTTRPAVRWGRPVEAGTWSKWTPEVNGLQFRGKLLSMKIEDGRLQVEIAIRNVGKKELAVRHPARVPDYEATGCHKPFVVKDGKRWGFRRSGPSKLDATEADWFTVLKPGGSISGVRKLYCRLPQGRHQVCLCIPTGWLCSHNERVSFNKDDYKRIGRNAWFNDKKIEVIGPFWVTESEEIRGEMTPLSGPLEGSFFREAVRKRSLAKLLPNAERTLEAVLPQTMTVSRRKVHTLGRGWGLLLQASPKDKAKAQPSLAVFLWPKDSAVPGPYKNKSGGHTFVRIGTSDKFIVYYSGPHNLLKAAAEKAFVSVPSPASRPTTRPAAVNDPRGLANERLILKRRDRSYSIKTAPWAMHLGPNAKHLLYVRSKSAKIVSAAGRPKQETVCRLVLRDLVSGKDRVLPIPAMREDNHTTLLMTMNPFDPAGRKLILAAGIDSNGDGVFHSSGRGKRERLKLVLYDIASGKMTSLPLVEDRVLPMFDRSGKGLIVMSDNRDGKGGNLYTTPLLGLALKQLGMWGWPRSVCPTADVLPLVQVGSMGSTGILDCKLIVYDLKADRKIADLRADRIDTPFMHRNTLWTSNGRYLYYPDLARAGTNQSRKIKVTRIWDRQTKKFVSVLVGAVPVGPGPAPSTMVLAQADKRTGKGEDRGWWDWKNRRMTLHDAASGHSWSLGDKSMLPLRSNGRHVVYARPLATGGQAVYMARIVPPASIDTLRGWTLGKAKQAKGKYPEGQASYDWWTTDIKTLCFSMNGKLNGPVLSWYEDSGKKRFEGQCTGGLKVGVWRHWDPQGNIIAEGTYRDDKPWEGTFIGPHQLPTIYVKGVYQEKRIIEKIKKLVDRDARTKPATRPALPKVKVFTWGRGRIVLGMTKPQVLQQIELSWQRPENDPFAGMDIPGIDRIKGAKVESKEWLLSFGPHTGHAPGGGHVRLFFVDGTLKRIKIIPTVAA